MSQITYKLVIWDVSFLIKNSTRNTDWSCCDMRQEVWQKRWHIVHSFLTVFLRPKQCDSQNVDSLLSVRFRNGNKYWLKILKVTQVYDMYVGTWKTVPSV